MVSPNISPTHLTKLLHFIIMGRKEPRITNLDWYSHGNNVPDFEHFIDRALQNDTETQVLNYLSSTVNMDLSHAVGRKGWKFIFEFCSKTGSKISVNGR